MKVEVRRHPDYVGWFNYLHSKQKSIVQKRISNIEEHDHFGVWKMFDKVAELKFKNGTRIYFAIVQVEPKIILLLLGGNKNGQDKDIKKAEKSISLAMGGYETSEN